MQPTSPLRCYKDIESAIRFYLKNKNNSLISAYSQKGVMNNMVYTKKNNLAIPLIIQHGEGQRRQDSENIFVRNGAIYITSVKFIKKFHKIICSNPLLFEMPEKRSLNLDNSEDLIRLKKIL